MSLAVPPGAPGALDALGVDAGDYALIGQARRLVDQANASLAQAGLPVMFAVTMLTVTPPLTGWPDPERTPVTE